MTPMWRRFGFFSICSQLVKPCWDVCYACSIISAGEYGVYVREAWTPHPFNFSVPANERSRKTGNQGQRYQHEGDLVLFLSCSSLFSPVRSRSQSFSLSYACSFCEIYPFLSRVFSLSLSRLLSLSLSLSRALLYL